MVNLFMRKTDVIYSYVESAYMIIRLNVNNCFAFLNY